jgi:hypothetical protein
MKKLIGWKIAFIGIVNSITGIGLTITPWNLIAYDKLSVVVIMGLIICQLALIIFFEDLIAYKGNTSIRWKKNLEV